MVDCLIILRAADIVRRDLVANGQHEMAASFARFVDELERLMVLAEIGLTEDENGGIHYG